MSKVYCGNLAIEEMNNSYVNGKQIVVKYNKF